MRIVLLLGLLAPLAVACSSNPQPVTTGGSGGTGGTGGQGGTQEICDNGVDDDGNDMADCADPACATDAHCPFCGDGLRQGAESCDGEDRGGKGCLDVDYNGGGQLGCNADCTFDTSGCSRHEDCAKVGDEDHNGMADCFDPVCAKGDGCLSASLVDPPLNPVVTSAARIQVKVLDGTGAPVSGRFIHLTAPAGAFAPPASSTTGPDGIASFDIYLGRQPGLQTFTAALQGGDLTIDATLQAVEPAAGHVHTVVNASHQSGRDSSGAAIGAQVGKVLDLAVGSDSTLYLAEACQILSVSPAGVLSVVAGTGVCGAADDGTPALEANLSIGALVLDEPRSRLVFVDSNLATVRAMDLAGGPISTLAGGGSGGDGGKAVDAQLAANAVAVAPDGTLYISDSLGGSVRRVAPDGTISTALVSQLARRKACGEGVALKECAGVPCRPLVDAGGQTFISGSLCGQLAYPGLPDAITPGMVRLITGANPSGYPAHILGNASGLDPIGQPSTVVLLEAAPRAALDPAGNLFAIAGKRLLRVDDRTWASTSLARWDAPVFAGEDVPLAQASFANPAAMAFAPNGDLYVADTDDASVRRVVGLGRKELSPLTVTVTGGDGAVADVGQKVPKLSVKIEDAGKAVAGFPVALASDDPGMGLYPGKTGDDGTASFVVRLGLAPGEHTVSASLPDIHGGLAPDAGVLHLTAREPAAGTILSLTASDGTMNTDFTMIPGQVLTSTLTDLEPSAIAVSPEGTTFALTRNEQLVEITPEGALELLAGRVQAGGITDGDGGPAVDAAIDPAATHGSVAASRDQVFFLNNGPNRLVRFIDRHTGIIDTYLAADARSLAVDSDGALLLNEGAGIIRIDPVTREAKTVVPTLPDCSQGDGLAPGAHYFSVGSGGIAIAGPVCYQGSTDDWIGWADPTTGTLSLLMQSFSSANLAVSPAGLILFDLYGYAVQSLDPVTLETQFVVGPGNAFGEDIPATDSQVWSTGDMAFDSKGHFYLMASDRIRVVW